MKIICGYRKTIAMNSEGKTKRLTYTCSGSDTDLSSLCEDEITCTQQNDYTNAITSTTHEKQNEKQNAYDEEEKHGSNSFKYCGKNEFQSDLWLNQQISAKNSISETKDLLKDFQETLSGSQDYTQNDPESPSTVSNDGNLEENLQKFIIEQISEIRGKPTSKESDKQKIKKMIALNKDFQISLREDIKWIEKGLHELHQKFDCFCPLLSDLLKILHPKINLDSSEQSMNSEELYLTPLSLIAMTNVLAECISNNPNFKRTIMTKDLSQTRRYNCNKIGHIAKFCSTKKSNFTTITFENNFYTYLKTLLKWS